MGGAGWCTLIDCGTEVFPFVSEDVLHAPAPGGGCRGRGRGGGAAKQHERRGGVMAERDTYLMAVTVTSVPDLVACAANSN